MPFTGQDALITGAGSGIGRALALSAARRGMRLAIVGRRLAPLEETRRQLVPSADCLIIVADVTVPEGRQIIRARLGEAWERLDILVNNAGMVAAGPLNALSDAELNRLVATNLVAPIALTRNLLPLLRAGSSARVINIGSLSGDIALPLFAAYSASKFGLRGFSNALRRELKALGIGVTYVAPRGVQTDAAAAVAPFIELLGMSTPDSTGSVADQVWDAIERGADTVYPRGRERVFVLLERLFPSLITRTLAQQLENGGGRRLIAECDDLPADAAAGAPAKGEFYVVEP